MTDLKIASKQVRLQPWSSSWQSGGQWHAPAQNEQLPVQRRWKGGKRGAGSGGSPGCSTSPSRTFGERVGSIGRVRICRGTLKEARRCTRASSGCASDGMSSSVLRTGSIRWKRNEWWSNRHWRVALACLSRLRAEMARNPDPPPIVVSLAPTQPGVIQATDSSAEIWQLRARLAEVELERDVETKPFPSCCVPSRIRLRFGLHGQRIGEATNPGPSSSRRRTQRLRTLPWSWDSDTINGRAECGPRSGVSRDSCGI